ncbi:MAG: Hpt domain-containing protein [Desulfobulbaceae bacterium]|nr:Hpt domain-containing protein [Desulfobulbaceae bacterium]
MRFIARLDEQLQAVEIAIKENDMEEIAALAHWLKGAGGTVGFDVFTEPAAQLEVAAKAGEKAEVLHALTDLHSLADRIVSPEIQVPPSSITGGLAPEPVTSNTSYAESEPQTIPGKPVVSRFAAHPQFHRPVLHFVKKLKQQVVIMEHAWQCRDMPELVKFAGWLKGSAGTVGYDDFTEPAIMLEDYARTGQEEQTSQIIERILWLAGAIVPPKTTKKPK